VPSDVQLSKGLYGYEPNMGANPQPTTNTPQEVTEVITNREERLQLLKQRLNNSVVPHVYVT
jgi:hypothetical protein